MRATKGVDNAAALVHPAVLAEALAQEISREVDYLPVETDGATRAAARIAELLN